MSERWTVGDILEDDDGFEYVVVGDESEDRVASIWKGVFESEADALDRARLVTAAPALRDALRAVMVYLERDVCGCTNPDLETLDDCGQCSYCLAWQSAHDALAACEEVGDGTE